MGICVNSRLEIFMKLDSEKVAAHFSEYSKKAYIKSNQRIVTVTVYDVKNNLLIEDFQSLFLSDSLRRQNGQNNKRPLYVTGFKCNPIRGNIDTFFFNFKNTANVYLSRKESVHLFITIYVMVIGENVNFNEIKSLIDVGFTIVLLHFKITRL